MSGVRMTGGLLTGSARVDGCGSSPTGRAGAGGLMPSAGKTKARGYGAKHKRYRKAWARQVAAGGCELRQMRKADRTG